MNLFRLLSILFAIAFAACSTVDRGMEQGAETIEKAATGALSGLRGREKRACDTRVQELRERTTPPPYFKRAPYTYFVAFDSAGEITNDAELMRMRTDIQAHHLRRIVVLSYGWMNKVEEAHRTYVGMLNSYLEGTPHTLHDTAIVCIVWDSIARLEKPARDLLPADSTVNALIQPVSQVLTVATLWSKAAQADRIGARGLYSLLRVAQDDACAVNGTRPDIFLVGHSLGSRIVCSAVHASFLRKPLEGVRGMMLIQPALSPNRADLPSLPDFPIVITQSRHDHANSMLFPIASIPFNLSASRVGTALGSNGFAPLNDAATTVSSILQGPYMLPFSHALSTATQARKPGVMLTDTMAHLPIIEVPIIQLGKRLGYPNIGKTKGLFDLGVGFESAARSPSSATTVERYFISKGPVRFFNHPELAKNREWLERGVNFVDCSDVIRHSGLFRFDYEKQTLGAQLAAASVGWMDVLGSHTDYQRPEIYSMIRQLTALGRAK